MEVWKDIPGFEGYYQVSNQGNVKSLSRRVGRNGGFTNTPERILKPKTDKDGYKAVTLFVNYKASYFRVHRLVLLSFIGAPPSPDSFGMHLDDNPANNVLENLKWGSNSENILMAIEHGRKPPTRAWLGKLGKDHHRSRTVSQYSMNGVLLNTYPGSRDAARKTNIHHSCISACCCGGQLTAGGYRWKYDGV